MVRRVSAMEGARIIWLSLRHHIFRSFDRRRRFPLLGLERHKLEAYSKACALFWQSFLMTGIAGFRGVCYCVASITCDQGVEKFTAACRDIAPSIFRFIDAPPLPRLLENPSSEQILPRVILIAGWRHLWDTITRKRFKQHSILRTIS